jgi:hypothetical protein
MAVALILAEGAEGGVFSCESLGDTVVADEEEK